MKFMRERGPAGPRRLRELLAAPGIIMGGGAHDGLSARIVEQCDYPLCVVTGAGTSMCRGYPDIGLVSGEEMVANARYIAEAIEIPVIVDADNGYGNAINVIRAVREYIQCGVAAIHIEDQVVPKRCGHVAGRQVIGIEEAVGKFRAADAVRKEYDPDFVLIARTDARGAVGGSLDEAIRRANAYLEAGADLAFVEGPTSVEEVRRVCREVHGQVFYNLAGVSPRFGQAEMEELGIKVAIAPGATFRATMTAVYDLALAMREKGSIAEHEFDQKFKQHPLADYHTFAGFDRIRAWEAEFMPADEQAKYQGTVGHMPGGERQT